MTYGTPQEEFWAGEFGSAYASRNDDPGIIAGNTAMFAKVLVRTRDVKSVIEFGANIGNNLHAIRALLPRVEIAGVELNPSAFATLSKIPGITAHNKSLLGFDANRKFDLTLSKGVLIHINPDALDQAYEALYRHSNRYICVAEYYNPSPVAITYRGHSDRMFKRDFAGEILKKYPDLRLVDYGFVYRNDPVFPLDDITWFLLEKR
jgi:spore coat polysaccharide biosynthesis protein SpsF